MILLNWPSGGWLQLLRPSIRLGSGWLTQFWPNTHFDWLVGQGYPQSEWFTAPLQIFLRVHASVWVGDRCSSIVAYQTVSRWCLGFETSLLLANWSLHWTFISFFFHVIAVLHSLYIKRLHVWSCEIDIRPSHRSAHLSVLLLLVCWFVEWYINCVVTKNLLVCLALYSSQARMNRESWEGEGGDRTAITDQPSKVTGSQGLVSDVYVQFACSIHV